MLPLNERELRELTGSTLGHYEQQAESFWQGTRDHDVSQNIEALLGALGGGVGYEILDFGCGPGRDLLEFKRRGHHPVGLDGSAAFVRRAAHYAGVPVWHQQFLELQLPEVRFDAVFANASLFHVPAQELPRVLLELQRCLKAGGVLFASNPRGDNHEGYQGPRYGCYHDERAWSEFVLGAGFEAIAHYYRPHGLPREQQPWFCTLWRKPSAPSTAVAVGS